MAVKNLSLNISSKGRNDMVDITDNIKILVYDSGLTDGVAVIFCPGSTGALSTVEFEPGLLKDIPNALEKIAPHDIEYEHHKTWNDDNGSGHVKSTLVGPDLTVPFTGKKLDLGTWQQIVFIECDTHPRNRELVIKLIGE